MISRLLVLVFLIAPAVALPAAQHSAPANAESVEQMKQEVIQFEAARNRALVRNDIKMLSGMYADGLLWTNPRGQLLTKAEILGEMRSGQEKFILIHHTNRQVRIYGNTAVLNAYTTSTVRYNGVASNYPRRFTNVYVKRNGHWLLIVHQATPIVKPHATK